MTDLKGLKENSIHAYTGLMVYWSRDDKDEALDVSAISPKFNGSYGSNNSTVVFVDFDGEVYVTPSTRIVRQTLHDAGFKDCGSNIYVPFSNGDVPKVEKTRWLHLRDKARLSYESDFIADCEKWCDEHHIGKISDESLAKCFLMPSNGMAVRQQGIENRYYPICNQSCMDSTVVGYLGKYCTNNGKMVFVYRNGSSYVAKGYSIGDELLAAGFSKSHDLFVPFSNNEEILDLALKARWEGTPHV